MTRTRFARLMLGSQKDVHAFARAIARDADEAADLVQEAYVRAFSAHSQLREPTKARSWVFGIVHNLLRDRRRRERAAPIELLDGGQALNVAATVPAAGLLGRIEARDALRALDGLSDEPRAALLLADGWGLSYAEIALVLGCPIGTVRSRIARARARILSMLGEKVGRRSGEGA